MMAVSHRAASIMQGLFPKQRQVTWMRLFGNAVTPRTSTGSCATLRRLQARAIPLLSSCWSSSLSAPVANRKADKPLTQEGKFSNYEVDNKGTTLVVTWQDGQLSRFHSLWLRYSCHCKACLEENTGQRLFLCENLDPLMTIDSVHIEGENLHITFGGKETHEGHVPVRFLKHYDHSSTALQEKKAAIEINTYATKIPELSYQELTQEEDGLFRWLKKLADYGFCVVKGVPTEHYKVAELAKMIGPLQDTIYDELFEVKVSDHQLTNVAYSEDSLVYHQDLLYYESPPGLQFLHTIRFDDCVTGGESLIVDLFKVANEFRQTHPKHFETLASIPATFQKIHYGRALPVHMTFSRPLIGLNQEKQIVSVNWEPGHEGPIEVPEEQVELFYKAHIAFAKAVKEAPIQFEWRMENGDLLSFNNRRVCHARNGFVMNGGIRHLQGCYINIDHFKSQLNVLSQKFANGQPSKRVGNQCLF